MCPLCSVQGNETSLRKHWTEECDQIMLTCNFCGETTRRDTSKKHNCSQRLKQLLEDSNVKIGKLEAELLDVFTRLEEILKENLMLKAKNAELE
jgi:hypothetical protein